MATELAQAYVQIIPSAKGISNKLSGILGKPAQAEGTNVGNKMGLSLGKALISAVAALGIGKAISSAVSEGANLQQSTGGIETLFKDSANKMKQYANEAYKTVGLSANEYMENVTSFSASLIKSVSGDTEKAAEAANTAMIDMGDNANKMGTNLQDIQNAYQGFAKQNYTMLDNLKLGYGGTKSEMERLLKDAQAISGVEYNLENLADVYAAIHVIQEDLDITGTTAKEAASTISGSFAAMKASAQNVIGKLALGEDIQPALENLNETIFTYLGNLLPAIWNVIKGIPGLVTQLSKMIVTSLDITKKNVPQIVKQGKEFVVKLANSIIQALPNLIVAAAELVKAFGKEILSTNWLELGFKIVSFLNLGLKNSMSNAFSEGDNFVEKIVNIFQSNMQNFLEIGSEILSNIMRGITTYLPLILTVMSQLAINIADILRQALPMVFDTIVEPIRNVLESTLQLLIQMTPQFILEVLNLITKLGNTILEGIPLLLSATERIGLVIIEGIGGALPKIILIAGDIISTLAKNLSKELPQILTTGYELMTTLANAIWEKLPKIGDAAVTTILKWISMINAYLPDVSETGVQILFKLINGIISKLPELLGAAATLIAKLVEGIASHFPQILETGVSLLGKLVAGLIQTLPHLISVLPQIIASIVNAFAQYDWSNIGINMIRGIVNGIKSAAAELINAAVQAAADAMNAVKSWLGIQSPSKRAEKEIGKFSALGVGVGWVKNMPAKEMVASTKDALKKVAEESQGETIKIALENVPVKNKVASIKKTIEDRMVNHKESNIEMDFVTQVKESVRKLQPQEDVKNTERYKNVQDLLIVQDRKENVKPNQNTDKSTKKNEITINVYARESQDSTDIAQEVKEILLREMRREEAVFA